MASLRWERGKEFGCVNIEITEVRRYGLLVSSIDCCRFQKSRRHPARAAELMLQFLFISFLLIPITKRRE
jgi:hypothetical protein